MRVVSVVGGIVAMAVGVVGLVRPNRVDDLNMKLTPRWMKAADGGGVFGPDQKRFRVRAQTVALAILVLVGVGLILGGALQH